MKIDVNVLTQLGPTYGVGLVKKEGDFQTVINNSEKAPAKYEPFITGAGYEWSDSNNAYVNGEYKIYFFAPKGICIWTWNDQMGRVLENSSKLKKWLIDDEKYPGGKVNKFIELYTQMIGGASKPPVNRMDEPVGDVPNVTPPEGPVPDRSNVGTPPSKSKSIIAQINKKYPSGKVPTDTIIDLYTQWKNDPEMMAFIKTLNPLSENKMAKSDFSELIREIVKGIIKEIKMGQKTNEDSVAASASPVTGPMALKKKSEEGLEPLGRMEEEQIDEMTTTMSGTPGYNIPGAFSREGGSKKGVDGSRKLGYELTSIGKKDMETKADKLYESVKSTKKNLRKMLDENTNFF